MNDISRYLVNVIESSTYIRTFVWKMYWIWLDFIYFFKFWFIVRIIEKRKNDECHSMNNYGVISWFMYVRP